MRKHLNSTSRYSTDWREGQIEMESLFGNEEQHIIQCQVVLGRTEMCFSNSDANSLLEIFDRYDKFYFSNS